MLLLANQLLEARIFAQRVPERIAPETYSLHIRVRTFTAFGDETIDPRRDNWQRYRAELEHGLLPRDPLKR